MPRVLCPCGEEMQAEPDYQRAFFCLYCGTLQFFVAQDLARLPEVEGEK